MTTPPPVVVVILGMHRSGTSLLARLLGLAGVGLGADQSLAPAAADNPRGFWEHTGLRDVNDALLHAFGGSWTNPPALPPDWLRDARAEPIRARAREILAREFQGLPLWGFKDPRTSLVAPFWQEILPGRAVWIVAVRNPLEVADSLQRRNGMPPALAEDLWNAYLRAALKFAPAGDRAILHYERLLTDPAGEIARLTVELRLPLAVPAAAVLQQAAEPDLRHHRQDPAAVQAAPSLRPSTKELYRRLWQGEVPASLEEPADEPGFRAAFLQLRAAYGQVQEDRDHLRSALAAREAEAQQYRLNLAELLQLRHDHELLRRRAEHRMGESLRGLLRRARPAKPS